MDYDEQWMIVYTIIRYHHHLLTAFEHKAWSAFQARWKADAYGNPGVERLRREVDGTWGDSRIDEVLVRGYDAFTRDVVDRVLREQAPQVLLNRCPQCRRIVRTPNARQCMWCYHDWH